MKYLICFFSLLVFAIPSFGEVEFERKAIYKDWLTPERLERWQGLSRELTYYNLYVLMEEMYYLPREPWPESTKQILLKMAKSYRQLLKDRKAGKPIIVPDFVAADKCGEASAYLYDMVACQNDPRFLFFWDNFNGGGASVEGLARIGEPAFEMTIRSFDRVGYPVLHWEAAKTLELMLEKKDSFLKTDLEKRAVARQALLRAAQSNNWTVRHGAINTLRYFPDKEVVGLLERISLTDPRIVNGQHPLRSRALEALHYMRANGNGF